MRNYKPRIYKAKVSIPRNSSKLTTVEYICEFDKLNRLTPVKYIFGEKK